MCQFQLNICNKNNGCSIQINSSSNNSLSHQSWLFPTTGIPRLSFRQRIQKVCDGATMRKYKPAFKLRTILFIGVVWGNLTHLVPKESRIRCSELSMVSWRLEYGTFGGNNQKCIVTYITVNNTQSNQYAFCHKTLSTSLFSLVFFKPWCLFHCLSLQTESSFLKKAPSLKSNLIRCTKSWTQCNFEEVNSLDVLHVILSFLEVIVDLSPWTKL